MKKELNYNTKQTVKRTNGIITHERKGKFLIPMKKSKFCIVAIDGGDYAGIIEYSNKKEQQQKLLELINRHLGAWGEKQINQLPSDWNNGNIRIADNGFDWTEVKKY